jgi:hypothetical protein
MVAHATALLGPSLSQARPEAEPWILRLPRCDFVAHFLGELPSSAGRERLAAARARAVGSGPVVLEQPVHRSFNLVVLEARCLVPGLPRVDPRKLRGAGLVVRRLAGRTEQAWLNDGGTLRGWQPAPAGALFADSQWEPDASLRLAHGRARRDAATRTLLDRLPGPADASLSEVTSPLFPIPGALARNIGTTLLYGFLPVTSSERVEAAAGTEPPFSRADVRARVPRLLRPDREAALLPPTGITVGRTAVQTGSFPAEGGLRTLVEALTWLAQETGLFGGGPSTTALAAALDSWPLTLPERQGLSTSAALTFLYRNLLGEADQGFTSLRLPTQWPSVGAELFERIVVGAETAMRTRFAAAAAGTGRFDNSRSRYVVRCFARIAADHPGCPPRIVWSAPTVPFRIKAWHEGSDQPPVQIELPRPDRLRGLKPDVAFKVPPELQQFMDRLNLQGLLDGSAKPREGGITFGMICSFSIPLITLCAFIVLQLFLVLLNLLFFWLPFIRICLPFPKPADEEP